MSIRATFHYFQGMECDMYSFYRIPKLLFTSEIMPVTSINTFFFPSPDLGSLQVNILKISPAKQRCCTD